MEVQFNSSLPCVTTTVMQVTRAQTLIDKSKANLTLSKDHADYSVASTLYAVNTILKRLWCVLHE
jgi:hypothetical protein